MASIRDTPLGQALRLVGFKKYLRYPEEVQGFQVSHQERPPLIKKESDHSSSSEGTNVGTPLEKDKEIQGFQIAQQERPPLVEKRSGHSSSSGETKVGIALEKDEEKQAYAPGVIRPGLTHTRTLSSVRTADFAVERGLDADAVKSQLSKAGATEDGIILVDWYDSEDMDNPRNWSAGKKAWVTFIIW